VARDNAPAPPVPFELLAAAQEAAMNGWAALSKFIKGLKEEERKALEPESYSLKKAAKAADEGGRK